MLSAAPAATVALEDDGVAVRVAAAELLEVRSLCHEGEELLVAATELPHAARVHGRAAGITLLHPWANRLARDAFTAGGRRASLAAAGGAVGRDANGLPIHGIAAPPGAWRWEEQAACRAVARLDWPADVAGFPFPHTVRAAFALRHGRLEITTTLSPVVGGSEVVPVPVAFGWHPYLRLPGTPRGDWRLAMPARRRLTLDARGLPTGAHRDEPAGEEPLASRSLDDGYDHLADGALLGLRDARRRIRVRLLEGYPVAQVFAPAGVEVVSLEPMTAPVNALVTGRGLRLATPGEPFRATFAIDVRGYPGRG
jgi:galactose mutarotase-like enzyme